MQIPSIVTATVQKENVNSVLGIVVKVNSSGLLIISKIKDLSPFRNTPLCAGHRCLAINGEANLVSAKQAATLIKKAVGEVTIVAATGDLPLGTDLLCVDKKAMQRSTGIRFGLVRSLLVRVQYIDRRGAFWNTPISVGDICLSINGVPVSDPRHAAKLVTMSESNFSSIFFLRVIDFRGNAIQFLKERQRLNASDLYWTSLDICMVKINQSFPPVALRFRDDEKCEESEPWKYAPTVSANETYVSGNANISNYINKCYLPFMERVAEMNAFIDKKMSALGKAVTSQGDWTEETPNDGDFVSKLKELSCLHREGELSDAEYKAAKAKLLGLHPEEGADVVVVALPAAI